ncbi:MAG: energy transducer TonB [Candidatus Adiutrix sp.]|jgi:protein TonB|nr:energy transducer TonB [Candidatus Adiutrix sp.]
MRLHRDQVVFGYAAAAAMLLHLVVAAGVILAGVGRETEIRQTLAVMDFVYDEGGGQAGAGGSEPTPADSEPEPTPPLEPLTVPETIQSRAETSLPEEAAPSVQPPSTAKSKSPAVARPKAKTLARAENQAASDDRGRSESGPGRAGADGGGGHGQGDSNAFRAYMGQILHKMERGKKYPPAARARKLTGVAKVHLVVDRGGRVLSSSLAKSSGHPELDAEVLALVRRVSPLPSFPGEMTQASIKLTIPVNFSLH